MEILNYTHSRINYLWRSDIYHSYLDSIYVAVFLWLQLPAIAFSILATSFQQVLFHLNLRNWLIFFHFKWNFHCIQTKWHSIINPKVNKKRISILMIIINMVINPICTKYLVQFILFSSWLQYFSVVLVLCQEILWVIIMMNIMDIQIFNK